MAIFNSYVSLPEGRFLQNQKQLGSSKSLGDFPTEKKIGPQESEGRRREPLGIVPAVFLLGVIADLW